MTARRGNRSLRETAAVRANGSVAVRARPPAMRQSPQQADRRYNGTTPRRGPYAGRPRAKPAAPHSPLRGRRAAAPTKPASAARPFWSSRASRGPRPQPRQSPLEWPPPCGTLPPQPNLPPYFTGGTRSAPPRRHRWAGMARHRSTAVPPGERPPNRPPAGRDIMRGGRRQNGKGRAPRTACPACMRIQAWDGALRLTCRTCQHRPRRRAPAGRTAVRPGRRSSGIRTRRSCGVPGRSDPAHPW